MARNKDDDIFLGSDFEDFDSEFEDFDFGDGSPIDSDSDRSPASRVKNSVTAGLKSAPKEFATKLSHRLQEQLPRSSKLAAEAMQFTSDAKALQDNFVKEIQPSINQLKKAGRVLAPKFSKYLPNKLQAKLDKALKESYSYSPVDEEEARSTAIAESLDTMFAVQETRERRKYEDDRTDKFVDRTITKSRHLDTLKVLDAIRSASVFQKNFTSTIGTAYLKKSLELKYQHLFVAKDTLAVTKGIATLIEDKLEQIRHNTALPDIQKQQIMETHKEITRAALAQRFNTKAMNWGKTILNNIKSQILDPASMGLGMAAMGADTMTMFDDMDAGLGSSTGPSKSTQIGSILGRILGSKAATKISSTLFGGDGSAGLVTPYGRSLEDVMANLRTRAMLNVQAKADSSDQGTMSSFLWNLLSPGIRRDGGSIVSEVNDPFEPVQYDKATRLSIVEIIPGFLSKILQQTTRIATGKDAEELTYDIKSRDFTTVSQFKAGVLNEAFSSAAERSSDVGRAVGVVRGTYAHLNEDLTKFDKASEDIAKVIVNAFTAKYPISPETLKAFTSEAELTSKEDDYISAIFKGIKNPKLVARILVSSLYTDENTVNTAAVNEINRYVFGLMTKDDYLDYLPKYVASLGQSRHLKGLVSADGGQFSINQDFIQDLYNSSRTKEFAESVNDETERTKRKLDQSVLDKLKTPQFVQDMLDPLFGHGTKVNVREDAKLKKFKTSKKKGGVKTTSSDLLPTSLDIDNESILTRTILHGTEITVPVHLVSSDVEFSIPEDKLPKKKEETPVSSITTLEEQFKLHKDRQDPVPDLLTEIRNINQEMNDKLLAMSVSSESVIGNLWHRGQKFGRGMLDRLLGSRTWASNKYRSFKESVANRLHNLTTLTAIKDRLIDGASSARDLIEMGGWNAWNWFNLSKKKLKDKYSEKYQDIKDNTSEKYTELKDKASSKLGMVKDTITGTWQEAKDYLSDKYGFLKHETKKKFAGIYSKYGSMKDTIKDKWSNMKSMDWKFVDVYLKDKIELGKPLLSKKKQEEGVIFSDQKPVRTSYDISLPVIDPNDGQTLITEQDIEHGLVDVEGNLLTSKSKAKKAVKGLFGLIGGTFSKFTKLNNLKDLFNQGSWMSNLGKLFGMGLDFTKFLGSGAKSLFDKFTGKERTKVELKDLKSLVGDKLDNIYNYLVTRFGETPGTAPASGISKPGDMDGDGKRDTVYEEMLADQQLKAEKETTEREETNTETLKDIRNLMSQQVEFSEEEAKERKGGLLSGLMEMFMGKGGGLGGKIAAGLGGAGIMAGGLGLLKGAAAGTIGAITSGIGSISGLLAGGAIKGGGALAALLASNPIGWGIAGTLAVGGAAYGGYKWLNPSGDDILEARSKYYGVDLDASTGIFSESNSKKLIQLEEDTLEILSGNRKAFNDKALEYWTDRFGLDSSDPEQVNFWATWYRQRFIPVFRVFTDLIRKAGFKYENIDEMDEETLNLVAKELHNQVASKVTEFKDLIPTKTAFTKFQKVHKEILQERAEGKDYKPGEVQGASDATFSDSVVTNRADKYRNDLASTAAASRMSLSPDPESPAAIVPDIQKSGLRAQAGRMMNIVTGAGSDRTIDQIDTSGFKPQKLASDELGALSAKYESSTQGSVAIGYDPKGGTSYGIYQIASNTGTFGRFLQWLTKQGPEGQEVAKRLHEAGVANTGSKNGAVPNEWKKLAMEGKLKDFEHKFIKETHYDVALRGIKNPELVSMIQNSKILQDVLWSTAVQHGPGGAVGIFTRAYNSLAEKSPEQFIKAIYGIRGGNFGSSPANIQASVRRRFGEEAATALAMWQKEKAMDHTSDTAVADASDTSTRSTMPSDSGTEPTTIRVADSSIVPAVTTRQDTDTGMDLAPTSTPTIGSPVPESVAPSIPTASANPPISSTSSSRSFDSGEPVLIELRKIVASLELANSSLNSMVSGQAIFTEIRDNLSLGFDGLNRGMTTPVGTSSKKDRSMSKIGTSAKVSNAVSVSRANARPSTI